MNKKEIDAYIDEVFSTYSQSVLGKYEQWQAHNPERSFDSWAALYHPQWYAQFGTKNARSN